MKKDEYKFAIQPGIKIAVFLLIMSIIPFQHGVVFWMSLPFTVLSYGVYVFGKHRALYVKPTTLSAMYECPIIDVFEKFIKAEIVLCIVFIIIGIWVPIWLPMIAYCVLIGSAISGIESKPAEIEK